MIRSLSALAPALCLAFAADARNAVRISFAPPPGVALASELALELDAECVELTIEAFGEPVPAEELPDEMTEQFLSARIRLGAGFTDSGFEYLEAESAPARFLREVDELSFGGLSFDGVGDLSVGTLLRYTRDGEDYAVRVVDDPGDEEGREPELAQLVAPDLAAAFLLPDDEVEAGDAWTVPLGVRETSWLLLPGLATERLAELPRALGAGDLGIAVAEEFLAGLEEGLEGAELQVELRSVEDGVATLDLEGNLALEVDLSRTLLTFAESILEDGTAFLELEATLALEVDWSGSLTWNLADSAPLELELEADWTADLDSSGLLEDQGAQVEIETIFAWEGTQESSLTATRAD